MFEPVRLGLVAAGVVLPEYRLTGTRLW